MLSIDDFVLFDTNIIKIAVCGWSVFFAVKWLKYNLPPASEEIWSMICDHSYGYILNKHAVLFVIINSNRFCNIFLKSVLAFKNMFPPLCLCRLFKYYVDTPGESNVIKIDYVAIFSRAKFNLNELHAELMWDWLAGIAQWGIYHCASQPHIQLILGLAMSTSAFRAYCNY